MMSDYAHYSDVQKQIPVTSYFSSKKLLLFAIALKNNDQGQTAVTAYFSSKWLLLFAFAWPNIQQAQNICTIYNICIMPYVSPHP